MYYCARALEPMVGVNVAFPCPAVLRREPVGARARYLGSAEREARRAYFPAGLKAKYVVVIVAVSSSAKLIRADAR